MKVNSVADAEALARLAHEGQTDRIGVPYIEHVRAVAAGLAAFGPELQMAGLLHDVIEDTPWTAERLRAAGVPDRVVGIVEQVTNHPDVRYEDKLRRIAAGRDAALVKIADNAHNSRPDRAARLPREQRLRLAAKYRGARAVLWPAVPREDVATILAVVNPALLSDLPPADGRSW
jgi:(p)ppGpp synthase/HD superfamily hydrolase